MATVPLVLTGLGFGWRWSGERRAARGDGRRGARGDERLAGGRQNGGHARRHLALTTIGLRRYYSVQVDLPAPAEVCETGTRCAAYTTLLKEAGLAQLQTVFVGAAVCAVVAGVLALVTFRGAATRAVRTAEALRQAG